MTDAPILYCSFCGGSQHFVAKLICAPGGVSICDGCVQTCVEIIDRSRTAAGEAEYLSWSVAA